jgi:alpha-2-macroglobulin
LPNSGQLVLPFEAINLKAVDVSIIKVYENNIIQFLQDQDLGGGENLRRVGKPIAEATLQLDGDKSLDLHRKNKFSLDINKYVKSEPGALYRVTFGFRPEYSIYTCTAAEKGEGNGDSDDYYDEGYYGNNNNGVDDDDAFWSRYDNYYPYGYNWEERQNPCSKSYYSKERWASRNIVASNLGIIAKRGGTNQLMVSVSNLLDAKPMGGVSIDVLDYQRQLIVSSKTDGDGWALIDCKNKPFLVVAKNGNERGYLKVDDGSSLPLSRFDVSGEEVQNGLKGMLFGERGVWRPGDSLFLSFLLEDRQQTLPKDFPLQFELFSPNGQLYKKIVQNNIEGGYNVFKLKTDAGSQTGNWLAKVKVGNSVFEKRIKIETIMPNRLKIDLDFGSNKSLGVGSSGGNLHANWLFGAKSPNLKAKLDAALSSKGTSFEKFNAYVFDNPTTSFSAETQVVFDGTLDGEGNAKIIPNFTVGDDAPGMLTANLTAKVFEPGGNFSIDNVSIPYHPFKSYVGLKLPDNTNGWGYYYANQNNNVSIVNVDQSGNALGGVQEVDVELYKVRWSWWWDNSGDDLSNFTQDQYNKLISTTALKLTNGKGNFNFKVSVADWGRYMILVRDKASKHITGTTLYIDDPVYGSSADRTDQTAATMLKFTSNKEKYNIGDNVELTIPSSEGGKALISIENGAKVLKTYWVDTKKGNTKFSFKAEAGFAPNVFVNVSMMQPHAQTLNDLPIRMYGVIPVMVEDKNTVLKPEISMPDVLKPEQSSSITVSEANGKEMYYTIALVDEGLLDVTRYKTPNPHASFYAREALGVKSWDLYDYVMGAYGTQMERILTIGGDDNAEPGQNKRANRFKPIVKFMGPFKLGSGSKAKHDFGLPPYIGSIKAMVVACGKTANYGSAEKTVQIRKPLMLLATVPRVLGPEEKIKIPVTVFAMEKGIKNVTISLEANPFIAVDSLASQTVVFDEPGEKLVNFNVRVQPNTGIGKVKILASSGAEKTEYEVEVDIRNPNPPVTSITEMVLQPGQSWNQNVAPIGLANTAKATVELSSIPNMNLEKRLSYLITYPYGCVEQTTSAAFPQLVLDQFVELSETRKLSIANNVKSTISRLRNFQTSDGGFAYWPGEPKSDEWGSNYAGHFLLEAQAAGYDVGSMLNSWKNYIKNKCNSWSPSNNNNYGEDLTQAYRVYLLAVLKSPDIGAMNRLKEYKFLSPEGKWQLAAAYALANQQSVAKQLVGGMPYTFEKRDSWGYTYGSSLRDEAIILQTLNAMGEKTNGYKVVENIARQMVQESWYSTQTTAYCLVAVAKFCGKNPNGSKLQASATINGVATSVNSNSALYQQDLPFKSGAANTSITNKGNAILFVRIVNQGTPLTGQGVVVNNNPNVLVVKTEFIDQDKKPLDVTALTQGKDFVCKITVTNPGTKGYYSNIALNQIFPSGWEIINTRLYDNAGAFQSSTSDYRDIRDDRVYTFFGLSPNETKTFYVLLNAAYLGRYYWAGTYCEAMYDNSISGGTTGKWVEVK